VLSRHIPGGLTAEPASGPELPCALTLQGLAELALRLFLETFRVNFLEIFRVNRTLGLLASAGHAGILPPSCARSSPGSSRRAPGADDSNDAEIV
jgi:hypothetical protein